MVSCGFDLDSRLNLQAVPGGPVMLCARLGVYDHNRDIDPRNQRALTLLGLLLECSLVLFTLVQNPNLLCAGLTFASY